MSATFILFTNLLFVGTEGERGVVLRKIEEVRLMFFRPFHILIAFKLLSQTFTSIFSPFSNLFYHSNNLINQHHIVSPNSHLQTKHLYRIPFFISNHLSSTRFDLHLGHSSSFSAFFSSLTSLSISSIMYHQA